MYEVNWESHMISVCAPWVIVLLKFHRYINAVGSTIHAPSYVMETSLILAFIVSLVGLFLDKQRLEKVAQGIMALGIVVILVGFISSAPIFTNNKLSNILKFDNEVYEVEDLFSDENEIIYSFVDKNSAELFAREKLGELKEKSSILKLSSEFEQLSVEDKMVRVAPYIYNSSIQKFKNRKTGLEYYVLVETSTGENAKAEVVKLEKPMKFFKGAYFNNDVRRHVKANYKNKLIGDEIFELDATGRPVWVVQINEPTVGLFGKKRTTEVAIVDAHTGEIELYKVDDAPKWVDKVFNADVLLENAKLHYKYKEGYFASMFGAENLKKVGTKKGEYTYISINGDIYVFTGIMPPYGSDSSNSGLLLINQRTGVAIELNDIAGASFETATKTATGDIAEKGYTPATPSILHVNDELVYVMSLQDESGVIRGFSVVNYGDYTISANGKTLVEAMNNYNEKVGINPTENGNNIDVEKNTETIIGKVEAVKNYTVNGNSVYLFVIEGHDEIFMAEKMTKIIPFIKEGDNVELKVSGDKVVEIKLQS